MGEIGEEGVAEGIVAEVLDDAAAIGVGVGLLSWASVRVGKRLSRTGRMECFHARSMISSWVWTE